MNHELKIKFLRIIQKQYETGKITKEEYISKRDFTRQLLNKRVPELQRKKGILYKIQRLKKKIDSFGNI